MYVYARMHVHIYTYTYIYIYIHIKPHPPPLPVYMCTHIYVCMYVYTYIYICIYTYTYILSLTPLAYLWLARRNALAHDIYRHRDTDKDVKHSNTNPQSFRDKKDSKKNKIDTANT